MGLDIEITSNFVGCMDPNEGMGFDNYGIPKEIQVLDKALLEIDY